MHAGRQALTTGRQDLSMTSAIAKKLPPYRLDTLNSRHAVGERFRVHVLGRFRLLGGDNAIRITASRSVLASSSTTRASRADIASGRVRTRHPISTFESHLPSTIACGRGRRDTPGNQKWSGRWESNPNGRFFKAYKMQHLAHPGQLRAIGVRIFAL